MRGGAGAFRAVLSEGGLLGAKELGQKVDPAHLSVSWSFQLTRSSLQDFLNKSTELLDVPVEALCRVQTSTVSSTNVGPWGLWRSLESGCEPWEGFE